MYYYIYDWDNGNNSKPIKESQAVKIKIQDRDYPKYLNMINIDNPSNLFKLDSTIKSIIIRPPNDRFPFHSIYVSRRESYRPY
jgi:hypothetical protein